MLKRFKSSKLATSPTVYPPGTFLKTEKGYFYIRDASKRYRLISERVVSSWRPHRIVETTEAAVSKYRIAAKMRFRDGSLIHSLTDGRVYLVVSGSRHPLVSPEAFERIGSHPYSKEIITVSKEELLLHDLGDEIS